MTLADDGAHALDDPARAPILETRDVSVRYGTANALIDVNLQLQNGCTALLGPNGAGKSTLMSVLAGVRPPTTGSLLLAGRPVRTRAGQRRLSEGLGYLPQEARLSSQLTVHETMFYAAWLKRLPESKARRGVGRSLEAVGLEHHSKTRVGSLSGGMRRRLAIAQSLVSEPAILLLDEPTTGLDVGQRAGFRELIAEISATTAVLVSTHVVGDVAPISGRVAVLDGGRLRFEGPLDELCLGATRPTAAEVEAAYLSLTGGS